MEVGEERTLIAPAMGGPMALPAVHQISYIAVVVLRRCGGTTAICALFCPHGAAAAMPPDSAFCHITHERPTTTQVKADEGNGQAVEAGSGGRQAGRPVWLTILSESHAEDTSSEPT